MIQAIAATATYLVFLVQIHYAKNGIIFNYKKPQ